MPNLVELTLPSVSSPNFKAELVAALRRFSERVNDQLTSGTGLTGAVITNLSKDAYYAARFTVDDWQGPDATGYWITIAHNLHTLNICDAWWSESFEDSDRVMPLRVSRLSADMIKVWVADVPDNRFAGRVVILARPETVIGSGGGVGGGGGGGGGTYQPTEQITLRQILELPYGWNNTGTIRLSYLAGRNKQVWDGFQVLGAADQNNLNLLEQDGVFAYAGTLARSYGGGSLEVDDTGFVFTPLNATQFGEFVAGGGHESRADLFTYRRRVAIIDTEIVAVQRVEQIGSTGSYRVFGVLRGQFDTRATIHAAGSKVFFWRTSGVPFTITEQAGWDNGVTWYFKAIHYSASLDGYPASMVSDTYTFTKRGVRPYGVQNLAVDGDGARPRFSEGVAARLTWLARNRDDNGTYLDAGYAAEGGTDFVVRLFDPNGNQIDGAATVAADQTTVDGWGVTRFYYDFTIPEGSGFEYITARVNARLNGLESLDTLNRQQLVVRRAS